MTASSPSDPARLRRLNELLAEALDLPLARRAAWLAELSPRDQELAPSLKLMLDRAGVETDTFMRRPLDLSTQGLGPIDFTGDLPGDLVGPYRLVRELGAGGMATVWLADRADGAMSRQVALKLPRYGWALGLAQRMARERDILAALEHPNIARLYDAGVTAQARPWLAMEFVSGLPIDEHCTSRALTTAQRLNLFLQVADAVTHAHSRLIVHRDLKPSNILVNQFGDVRLLDFGVAKLLGSEVVGGDLTQAIGQAVTPDYASPEQVGNRPLTVATDVYSLGIVLYELLTGERPYRLDGISGPALSDAIVAAVVPAASSRVSANRALAKQLRGDLDNILAKALRKKPEQRYPSVESMAADIVRHLGGEPVLARPHGRWYRSGKVLWRHRVPVFAALAVTVALSAGLGMAVWQAREAERQSAMARAALARSDLALDFSTMVLSESVDRNESITLSELIRRSEQMTDRHFTGSPAGRLQASSVVASWHMSYGNYDQAESLLTRRIAQLSTELSPLDLMTARCQRALARSNIGRRDEGIAELDEVIAAARAASDAGALSYCLQRRGYVARSVNDVGGALRFTEEALSAFAESGRQSPSAYALLLGDMAYSLSLGGRPAAAESYYRQAAHMFSAAGRAESGAAVTVYNNWALAQLSAGNPRQALVQIDRALEISRRKSTTTDPPAYLLSNRGAALRGVGRYTDAANVYADAVVVAERGANSDAAIHALAGQAAALEKLGRFDDAQRLLSRAETMAKQSGARDEGPALQNLRISQALLWQSQGRFVEAEAELSRQQARIDATGLRAGPNAWVRIARAEIAMAQRRIDDAGPLAEQALKIAQVVQGDMDHSVLTGHAWFAVARVHAMAGRAGQARSSAEQALAHLEATTDLRHIVRQRLRWLMSSLDPTR